MPRHTVRSALGLSALLLSGWATAAGGLCRAESGARPLSLVELYTSEGCSSCPPADRWLSTLKGRPGVLALAFHVDYWDRLGWKDRFASPEATARQHALARSLGHAQVYTPQVLANGRDWRRWPALPAEPLPGSVTLTLQRDGESVAAHIGAAPGQRLAGYWAVLEDGHQSRVSAGENAGETLHHDHVVRLLQPVAPWSGERAQQWQLPVLAGVPAHPRRVIFVVTDANTLRPLQALALAC